MQQHYFIKLSRDQYDVQDGGHLSKLAVSYEASLVAFNTFLQFKH